MAESSDSDIQAQLILRGLVDLQALLNQTLVKEALDLDKNAITSAQSEILRRLLRSLKQYDEREGDIFYVGLLGHFSSGKSSTINSLLDLWKTPSERTTDLHPTDKTITLITRQDNANSLLGVIHEGHVRIRLATVEHSLLDHIVLADTPGTGEPDVIDEIARDFLPICDLILFVFSSTSPLDQTDMPLLQELHRRLPFIPIQFVVTRADELRTEGSSGPLTDENIDQVRKSEFLRNTIIRVNKVVAPQSYRDDDFLLIDNKRQYNTAVLRQFLEGRCNPHDPGARVIMHGHKLQYYRTGARQLKDFFSDFLTQKLTVLDRVVASANANIEKYTNSVQISNNDRTRKWLEHGTALRTLRLETLGKVPSIGEIPDQWTSLDPVLRANAQIRKSLEEAAGATAALVAQRFEFQLKHALDMHCDAAIELLSKTPAQEALRQNDVEKSLAHCRFDLALNQQDILPLKLLNESLVKLRKELESAIRGAGHRVAGAASDLEKLTVSSDFIDKCRRVIEDAKTSLQTDLKDFFHNVELYRSGVFAHGTKEAISALGIGRRLDEIELEFTDEDKASFDDIAMRSMFPDFETHVTNLIAGSSALAEGISTFRSGQKQPTIQNNDATIDPANGGENQLLLGGLADGLQRDCNAVCMRIIAKYNPLWARTKEQCATAIEVAQNVRRRKLRAFVGVSGLVAFCCAIGYLLLSGKVGDSIYATLGWGVTANLIGDAIGYGIAQFRDKFPETERTTNDRYKKTLLDGLKAAIRAETGGAKVVPGITRESLANRFANAYLQIFDANKHAWDREALDYLQRLRRDFLAYRRFQDGYENMVVIMCESASKYFNDADKNLSTLNTIAARIKERSIDPSFKLLRGTREELAEVLDKIMAVDFG